MFELDTSPIMQSDRAAAKEVVKAVLEEEAASEGFGVEPDLTEIEPVDTEVTNLTQEDRRLRQALLDRGFKDCELPKALRDRAVKVGTPSRLGVIVKRRFTGIVNKPVVRTVKQFMKNIGGKEVLLQKLTAVEENLNEKELKLLALLRGGDKRSMVQLILDTGVNPSKLIDNFAKGAIALGKVDAAIRAAENMPKVVNDLLRHALDREDVCPRCVGVGRMPKNATGRTDEITCNMCYGSGKQTVVSDHKEWAADKLLEIGGVVQPKGGGATVNVGVQVDASGQSFMSKMLAANEAILYPSQKVIDVSPINSSEK